MNKTVNGKTKIYGLIGNPVEHTLSPFIHNSLAEALNINMVYVPFHVTSGNLKASIQGAKALGVQGLNVTVPYKVEVMSELDTIHKLAKQAGAVNTIVVTSEGMSGYNTDIEGLKQCLINNQISLRKGHIVLIGAGGAAKAAAILCASQEASRISIINRSYEESYLLKEQVKKYYTLPIDILNYDEISKLEEIDIAIQCTPLGMYPKIDHSPIQEDTFYKKCHYAVDLIYNPAQTKFLHQAQVNGCYSVNGLEMLFYQAVKAFELWHHQRVDKIVSDEILQELKHTIYQ